jgi:integrase/recombinase XerD
MKLSSAVSAYVSYQRSLGTQFLVGEYSLKGFLKCVGDVDLERIDSGGVWTFLAGHAPITARGVGKLSTLRGFYRFLLARQYVSFSPLPTWVQKPPSAFRPHIYTHEELARLITATDSLRRWWDPLRAPTFRTLLALLYGAGLRIGEAMRLTVADVDIAEDLLTVRRSKFYKTRWVPICPELSAVLHSYFRKRRRWHRPVTSASAFFATSRKPALDQCYVGRIFREVRRRAGLDRPGPGGFRPRLHDLRHTSAVHRLITWYREGKDVHALLPYLSVYLGHLNLSGTQRYLTMTAELLDEANALFERYAFAEVNHV